MWGSKFVNIEFLNEKIKAPIEFIYIKKEKLGTLFSDARLSKISNLQLNTCHSQPNRQSRKFHSSMDGPDGTRIDQYEAFANRVLPDQDQEIEEFKYHTWNITNWSELESKTRGPEFEAGGWRWRVLLFPAGNHNEDHVSIYLEFADRKDAPKGWHSCVQFILALWNPEDSTQYIPHFARHRFTIEEPDWGFTRFYELNKLFTPSENRTRALIENNSTNITVMIRVFKDHTGFLWHNVTNYNSKKATGYVGLKNQGATGYMNTSLQLFYCIPYFRKAVYRIPTEDDEPVKSVSLALQRVFHKLQTSDTTVETSELTKSFGWDSVESLMQHDMREFCTVLINSLEDKMVGTLVDGAITQLFVGKIKNYIKCINIDYESTNVENYYDILLNVRGFKTLRDSFRSYVHQEETVKYHVRGGLQDAKKGVKFESFPPVLILQLNRCEYDAQKSELVKINDWFEYPMAIDLEEFLSEDADRSKSHNYLLHGVIVHNGSFYGGNYWALLKPEKDGKWFRFYDERITPVIIDKEVFENNYGSKFSNTNQKCWESTNAYMLVYIRESDVNEILSPVSSRDIPKHLRMRMREEKALKKRKEKEMSEMHLYLTVKVVTDEKFKNHQGFDLCSFEDNQYPPPDIHVFKVQKTVKYKNFIKKHVSRNLNISAKHIRFWVHVNRQNKTSRPDAILSEFYFNNTMEEIREKLFYRQSELRLYMEVAEKPTVSKTLFPLDNSDYFLVFLKYFNIEAQAMEGLGHLYVRRSSKVGDYAHILCEKKGFPPGTPLKLYEEIKPTMIDEMKFKNTFIQSEIQDGDIICFQKGLTEEEIQEHIGFERIYSIPKFYELFNSRIIVSFKPKKKDNSPEFELVLNKKWTYDQVAEIVAIHLNTDPLKLRFTSSHSSSPTPKKVISRTTDQILSDIVYSYLSVNILFYEMLDVGIIELETKRFFKITWLGSTNKEKEILDIRLQKNAVINDILEEILKRVMLTLPGSRIRLYEVKKQKIQNEYTLSTGSEQIDKISELTTLYAEEIPREEFLTGPNDRIIQVFHFTKEPLNTHGIPFKFVIKDGETLADTKNRLRLRLDMSEIGFSNVRIAIISGTLNRITEYLEDDDIILSGKILSNIYYLGLDHVIHIKLTGTFKPICFRG